MANLQLFFSIAYNTCDWLKIFNSKEKLLRNEFSYIILLKHVICRLPQYESLKILKARKARCPRTVESAIVLTTTLF